MKKIKITLTLLAFVAGIGATLAKSNFNAPNLWAKDLTTGLCELACYTEGEVECDVNPIGYFSEPACYANLSPQPARQPQ